MATPINPLPNLTQYNFDIGDIEEVVTKQNGVNAVLEQLGPQINATVTSINTDMAEIDSVKNDLNPAQIVHAPGSGLSNPAGTAYSRDTGTGTTQIPLNSDLGSASKRAAIGAGDVYARGGVVGTVSQSGGVPTGAIIERGGNSFGEWIKWADGRIEINKVFLLNFNQGAGTFSDPYRTTPFTFTYPVSITSSEDRLMLFGCTLGSTSASRRSLFATSANVATNQAEFVTAFIIGTTQPSEQVRLSVTVIGRWF